MGIVGFLGFIFCIGKKIVFILTVVLHWLLFEGHLERDDCMCIDKCADRCNLLKMRIVGDGSNYENFSHSFEKN